MKRPSLCAPYMPSVKQLFPNAIDVSRPIDWPRVFAHRLDIDSPKIVLTTKLPLDKHSKV